MHKIAILNYDQASLFELACAVELFAIPRPELEDWYSAEVVSFECSMKSSSAGLLIQNKVIEDLSLYDTLVIPSWPIHIRKIKGTLADQVLQFHKDRKRILSFCSGAFLLGSLGLLDGRKATTHWRYARRFQQRFPDVNYIDDVLYVYENALGCSAGSAAAIDLCLAVIRADFGHQVANQVARRLVISAHRQGGQAQFIETPVIKTPNQFGDAIDWAMQNLHRSFTIEELAGIANMSRRSFDRKFNGSYGMTPKRWLTQQRIDRAKDLLTSSPATIETIAGQAGFDSATTLRHHFRQLLGLSPRQYRDQYATHSKINT